MMGLVRGPAVVVMLACGVATAAPAPDVRVCADDDRDRVGVWRYALTAPPFDPTYDLSVEDLRAAWQRGDIGASGDTEGALTAVLGARGQGGAAGWSIVPAHELTPATSVITIGGAHPLVDDGPLAVALCGASPKPVANIDRAKLTTLVMSGTTALTGRTSERIDEHGIEDTVRHIKPFFTSADVVHISNEVSFVRNCKPRTGQDGPFVFCARDRYVDLLAALNATVIELTGSHLIDYGHRSLMRTIAMYEKRGWRWFGGGRTQLEATEPLLVTDHGNKLAFVGCNAVNWWVKAIYQGPGAANCDWPRMVWQIQDLRRRGYTPIASVQHRELRVHTPPPDLVSDLRRLAEAGAVFVAGSQAHVAHPWDVHFGAYIHYGPGNILFAQYRDRQRQATVDKLFIHDGKLLTVAHMFTRTEHGQPRLLTNRERARFLGSLASAAEQIEPPRPTATPELPPASRVRPDSVVVRGRAQRLSVTVPARLEPGARYPLVVDLDLTRPARDDAFVVLRTGPLLATGEQIAEYMRAKYPIDPTQLTITPAPERVKVCKRRSCGEKRRSRSRKRATAAENS